MAIAKFHSARGEKSALILLKHNELVFGWTPVYVPRAPFVHMVPTLGEDGKPILDENGGPVLEQQVKPEFLNEDFRFDVENGYKLVPIVDDNGEVRTTKDGVELRQLAY